MYESIAFFFFNYGAMVCTGAFFVGLAALILAIFHRPASSLALPAFVVFVGAAIMASAITFLSGDDLARLSVPPSDQSVDAIGFLESLDAHRAGALASVRIDGLGSFDLILIDGADLAVGEEVYISRFYTPARGISVPALCGHGGCWVVFIPPVGRHLICSVSGADLCERG